MSFTPYMHFQGNCAEAMAYYAKVFGANDLTIMRYSDAPGDPGGAPPSDRVMHAHLTASGGALMASDFPEGKEGDPQQAVSISYAVATPAAGRKVFTKLADGGAVIMPFEKTFWSPGFGMLKDRFGTHWMVSVPRAV